MSRPETLLYKRATFVTQLPVTHLYSPSHGWLARDSDGAWRVGFTKFALRMLGELVDVQFETAPGTSVAPGEILGSIEGFKALSDLYCAGSGRFLGGNPALKGDLEIINRSPYDEGWLYRFEGEPDPRSLTLDGYRQLLDATIDKILEKQQAEESAS
jgi:glycine cleavage system H protein